MRSWLKGFAGREKPATFLAADKGIPYGEVVKVIDMLGSLGLAQDLARHQARHAVAGLLTFWRLDSHPSFDMLLGFHHGRPQPWLCG